MIVSITVVFRCYWAHSTQFSQLELLEYSCSFIMCARFVLYTLCSFGFQHVVQGAPKGHEVLQRIQVSQIQSQRLKLLLMTVWKNMLKYSSDVLLLYSSNIFCSSKLSQPINNIHLIQQTLFHFKALDTLQYRNNLIFNF